MPVRRRDINIEQIEKYFTIEEDGSVWSLRRKKYIKATFNTAGYLFVQLPIPNDDGTYPSENTRTYAVHRLVATKYISPCPPELETSHKDGDKLNNHYSNLEYLSHSQNILKSYREHGRVVKPYRHLPASYETKLLMSNAKKKRVKHIFNGQEIIYPSIEDAALSLNTYRKKIYRCIKNNLPYKDKHNSNIGGYLSFVEESIIP